MEIALIVSLIAVYLVWQARSRLTKLEARVAALTEAVQNLTPGGVSKASPIPGPDPAASISASTSLGTGQPDPLRRGDTVTDQTLGDDAATGGAWGRAGQGNGALQQLGVWLRDHWIYPAAAAALVLSGIFLVQYAVEAGLLTPQARVILALILATALAGAGEALRRRPAAGQILPAVLTGSGLVIAMAAVLAALHLYAMISQAMALLVLAALAFSAIGLGWVHGPMLAALGLVAGTIVPFVLGGQGPPPAALFGYFALLSLMGLGIDAARRWGWVTWLALAGPVAGAVLWRLAGGDPVAFALAMIVVAGGAMTLPFGRVMPVVAGRMTLQFETGTERHPPVRGVRASFVASGAAGLGAVLLMPGWEGPLTLTVLAVLVAIWARNAPALGDQVLVPVLGLPAWIVMQAFTNGPIYTMFTLPRLPESSMPMQATLLVALGLVSALAMMWRDDKDGASRQAPWVLAGLAVTGGVVATLETLWNPALSLGAYPWALHIMGLAGLATAAALRYAQADAGQGPRLGAAAAAAFALIALGLMVLLGLVALTVALAVLMVAAAVMDRRFDIPGLGAFQVLASAALIWRLVLDPGLGWLLNVATGAEVALSLVATVAAPLAALWLSQYLPETPLRNGTRLVVETGAIASAAIATGVVIARFLPDGLGLHAQLGLQASALIALSWAQVRRMRLSFARRFRQALAYGLGMMAGGLIVLALVPASPVFGTWPFGERVSGWPVLNDLLVAYLLPGCLLIGFGGWRMLRLAGWALVGVWVGCAIRHLWQGENLSIAGGIAQGELYAYTFALLVTGALLLARAVLSGQGDLRKLGLAVIAVAAAKAFLIDASGLDGLLRVGAFLGLGLSLASLAWVNGWAVAREGQGKPETPDVTSDPDIR